MSPESFLSDFDPKQKKIFGIIMGSVFGLAILFLTFVNQPKETTIAEILRSSHRLEGHRVAFGGTVTDIRVFSGVLIEVFSVKDSKGNQLNVWFDPMTQNYQPRLGERVAIVARVYAPKERERAPDIIALEIERLGSD